MSRPSACASRRSQALSSGSPRATDRPSSSACASRRSQAHSSGHALTRARLSRFFEGVWRVTASRTGARSALYRVLRGGVLLVALSALLSGCPEPAASAPSVRASFGIFYGGQVQERDEIPFEIDRAKQSQGFRLEFTPPLKAARRVTWEVDQPAQRGKRPTPSSRVTALGEAEARAGSDRLEVPLELAPGDPLGEWNLRVMVDGELVLDQRFAVYNAAARARAMRTAEEQLDEDE